MPGDRDFEKCRQFVRMAGNAAKAAALTPPGADPVAVAKKSLAESTQQKIAKSAPALRSKGASGKPTPSVLAGFGPGVTAPKASPVPMQQAMARGAPPSGTSGFTSRPTGQSKAPLRFEPITAARSTAVNSTQPQSATGAPAMPGTGGRCGKPWNCTCGKCKKAGQAGHWVRRGKSIVIINC